ncbi:helix-turn-helix domain-containing protein [Rhodanobacter sp. A1T4]|uniref:helix-turn-helix domain-containing protein n=1 Tax=Rhodanobacter sp. A1T4 TaxID=2723087 RepID=UPI00161FB1B6|nr:helix-turn-helix domain-containing protein [Rhodanobacter sp. A1T4]MBB6248408.1 putative DNA-binding transcriptional regulator [Rhodanobacter sp. A1T4]
MQNQSSRTETDALRALDMKVDELKVYESLLERPGSTPVDVVAASNFSAGHVRRLLGDLESKGFVTRSPERVAKYHAVAPDLAFGALVAQRQSGLQAALGLGERLAKIRPLSSADKGDELTVELITGRDALTRVISQFYENAKYEILEFDRPPYVNPFETHMATHVSMKDRKVICRTICDTTKLDWPAGAQHIQDCLIAGEEQRLYEGVPIKAAIIDRRMALVPLHLKSASDSGLLLRPSLLLDTLCAHFDMLWQLAVPIRADGALDTNAGKFESAELEQLVAFLANGLKDQVIANRLKISERTFERRISLLQKRLKANTRFQAGWNAAMRAVSKSR